VKVIDPSLKRLFNIDLYGAENKVSESARINYSICASANRVFLYGGVNEKSQVLGSMDCFDACTYKFTPIKYRGDYTPKGRQAHCAVALDKFTMVVIGGTF
jgi:hypothetical protein